MSRANQAMTLEQANTLEILAEALAESQDRFLHTRPDPQGLWLLVGRAPGLPDDWDLWNPWTDNHDAFSLMVYFDVSLRCYETSVLAYILDHRTSQTLVAQQVAFEPPADYEALTREAIVRVVQKLVLSDYRRSSHDA